ncbi:hypothetical protein XENORESO_003914, partial [Xenotaenia resolanae]
LERDEMDGQLDWAKTELFAERCHSREKIESLQEVTDQQESLDVQVSKPQHELEECRIRVGTQDKMLAQKELQLAGLQEKCETLQTERDNLKRKLQHLKSQHCRELEEAQEKAHAVMEHTEELCSLKCLHWTEGGTATSLCRQRKARDLELRRLQMSMGQ